MKILVIGGSGFVSGRVVNEAIAQGNDVWYVTRGNRDNMTGAHAVIADRGNAESLRAALRSENTKWDAVLDCICFNADHARVDIEVLPEFTERVVLVSTDSLYHPDFKSVPQDENGAAYMEDQSYGGLKRSMELAFINECPDRLKWTFFRPPHMFGAGSELGCFPMHTRQKDMLACLREGKPVSLVGGGEYLIQPLYVGDLAKAMVAAINNPAAGKVNAVTV